MRRINLRGTVAVLLTASVILSNAVGDVTVDVNTSYQKIAGFGACSAFNGLLTSDVGEKLWSTTKGAGLSLHRVIIDPNGVGSDETNNAKMAASYGVKVWGSPWSVKNGVRQSGRGYDTLYEKDYQAWADVLAAAANKMKDMGAPLFAISSGNETDLGWTKYSPQALAVWVKKYMGPTLAGKAPDTKIVGIEPCNWYGFDTYYNFFKSDPDAWKYSSILATHEYGGSPKAYPEINAAGKEFWETEWSDDRGDGKEDLGMSSALRTAKMIHEGLTISNLNAWHYWNVYGNNCGGLLTYQKVASKRLWTMGNWSRFVLRGFVRVKAPAQPATGLTVTAFRDSALTKVVIVAINNNNNTVSQNISITGTSPLGMTPFITDSTRDLAGQSAQTLSSNSFTYTFPAQSVTSLVIDLKITPLLSGQKVTMLKFNGFKTGISNGKIVISPENNCRKFNVSVFMPDGQLITRKIGVTGVVAIPAKSKSAYLVNINYNGHSEKKKVLFF
jgi:glucuronoarabinoxylan endo-1,4-beta-xylanase